MDPQAGLDPTSGTNKGLDPIATPQAGAADPNPTIDPKPQAGKSIASLEDALAVIKDLRDENAKRRDREKGKDTRISELESANKTQAEKDADELKRLRTLDSTWRDTERAHALETAITKALVGSDARDVDIVEWELRKSDLTIDENTGKPTADSLSAALAKLKVDKPFLFKQEQAAPTKPTPTSAGAGTNVSRTQPLTKATLDNMSEAEINARWDEVQELLRSGR